MGALSGESNVNSAAVFVAVTTSTDASGTEKTASASIAEFRHYPGAYGTSGGTISIGSCFVTETPTASTSTGIDVGTLTLMGPAGSYTFMSGTAGLYDAEIPSGGAPPGGTFVITWTGGSPVGASSATVTLPNPFLTWTNESASSTVNRSAGITVNWSGGSPGSFVIITGTSSPPGGLATSFTCYAPQSASTFTVPSYVTELLPAGSGTLGLVDTTPYTRLMAPGLNSGAAWASSGVGLSTVTYQ